MSAPAERLWMTDADARQKAELEARVDELNGLLAAEKRLNEQLTFQRDMARQTVDQQQAEFQQWRLRPTPRTARYTTRDVPTGDLT